MFTDGWEAEIILELEKALRKLSQEEELKLKFIENTSSKKFLVTRETLIEVSRKDFFQKNHLLFLIGKGDGSRLDGYFVQYGSYSEHIVEIEILLKKYFSC